MYDEDQYDWYDPALPSLYDYAAPLGGYEKDVSTIEREPEKKFELRARWVKHFGDNAPLSNWQGILGVGYQTIEGGGCYMGREAVSWDDMPVVSGADNEEVAIALVDMLSFIPLRDMQEAFGTKGAELASKLCTLRMQRMERQLKEADKADQEHDEWAPRNSEEDS